MLRSSSSGGARGRFFYSTQGKWEGLSTIYSLTHYARTSHQRVVVLTSLSALFAR